MKVLGFIHKIFKQYPRLLILSSILLVSVSFFSTFSLFTISPIVDFLIHPDLQGISPLTTKAIHIMELLGLPITLWSWLIILVLLISLSVVFQVFAHYTVLKMKYAVLRDMMVGALKDFFDARWHFFSSSSQGVLLNSFNRELLVVGNTFRAIAAFFASMIQIVFFLIVPFYISWQVTSISLCLALFFSLPLLLLGKYCYNLGVLSTTTANQLTTVLHENFMLAKILLGFGHQKKNVEKLADAYDAHTQATIQSQVIDVALPLIYRPLSLIIVVIVLFTARWFQVPLSEMMVLILALFQVALSVGNLSAQRNSLGNVLPSYEQIERLRNKARQMKQTSGTKTFTGFSQAIRIQDVSFAYPGHETLLEDIHMEIPKGKMIALVGKSGVGKSTLIDLIMGFYEPTGGCILFDDTLLQQYDINSYRHRIGYVPQDSVLFNTSIRENLLWANPKASQEELINACQLAYAHEFIAQLPKGYDTVVGDRGIRLSGGQIQRVALARAFLRRPDLLILDEATSALDTHSERFIQKAIENIARQTTAVVVAHRLSTIKKADCIYVLEKGRIVEQGTYAELVGKEGCFNAMVQLQELEFSSAQ